LSAELLSRLPRVDLAVNAASFQEMRTRDVEQYIRLIYAKLTTVLYSDNIDRHVLNAESPVPLSQLFTRYGSVFPPSDAYDDVRRTQKWDWFYSTFLLGPQELPSSLHSHIRVYFGPIKQGSVMDYTEGQFTMVG
jgi:hypothetical protein